jgi:hypothetical protein
MRTDGQTEDRLTDTYRRDRRTGRVETGGQPRERYRHRTEGQTDREETYGNKRVQADGQTNMTKLIDAFCDYAKVPKNKIDF